MPTPHSPEPSPLAPDHATLAAILQTAHDPIIATDLRGHITYANPAAARFLGHPPAQILGAPLTRYIPEHCQNHEQLVCERIRQGEEVGPFPSVRLAWDPKARDQKPIPVTLTISPLRDPAGQHIGFSHISRDLSRQQNTERELARLTRLHSALSQVNQTILRASSRADLFPRVCRILVEQGGFHLAWIGLCDPQTRRITPVAVFGQDAAYLDSVAIYGDDRPEGRGPTGQAYRSGQPYVCNDMHHNPVTLPWREQLLQHSLQASAGFPIRLQGQNFGVLTVYADEPCYFQDKEITLLAEIAGGISFALDSLAEKAARQQVEQAAANERLFSATMIESLPGILYFYDEEGRFLRWNRNFEIVSGYSHDEIQKMHPLDFFSAPEKGPLLQRINDVFTQGESSITAQFVSKDGTTTPYFFTGRRVQFDGRPCLVGVGVDISQRLDAEQRLAESERKYRELVQHAKSIILRWDSSGRILFLNEFGRRFFGYSAEEIIGRNVLGTIVPVADSSGRDLQKLMEQICANPKSFEQNINENIRRNGQRVWISWTNNIVQDSQGAVLEILSIGTDITEQTRAHQALRRSEEQFRLIMENLADLVAVLDLKGNRLYSSPSYHHILGHPEALLGSCSFEQIHPEDVARVRETFEDTVRTGVGHRLEYRLVDVQGRARYIESQGSVIRDSGGRVTQVVVVSRDVTERRQADQVIRDLNANLERRVEERTADLEKALVRAEAADRLKSAFLATMSHELRTPLNSIIGFTGILLQGLAGPLNAEQKKQLGMVRNSSRHLLELINDVLDLSKIEAGQLEIHAEPFDLPESLDRVIGLIAPLAEKKKLKLALSAPPGLPGLVSDRRRFEQIVVNLLNNAIKFTEQGSVAVTAGSVPEFRPSPDHPPCPAVRIEVADTGIGIKAEDLRHLFQPFRQVETGLTRQHEGTGLGLAICRRLVALLGGEISVRSEWAKGSQFTLTLPVNFQRTP